jgi:hypothetical protein
MKNLSGKWAALEKDGSTQHRCKNTQAQAQAQTPNHKVGIVTGGNESVPLSKTPQNNEIVIDHTKDKEDEIIALKKRIASIESWIKKVSESWVMNQQ